MSKPAVALASPGANGVIPSVRPLDRFGGWGRAIEVVAIAGLATTLNACKDLRIDDPFFHYYASHIAHEPLDPYGFELPWSQLRTPALHWFAPPVVPYWWALGMRLFGDDQFLWKMWLFPILLVLVVSMRALLRRFAPKVERPLLWILIFSPFVLPGINLMLDVPCLALGSASLALFLRASDRCSARGAILAGVILGLTMLTKWTGILMIGTLFCAGLFLGRLRDWVLAAAVGAALFAGFESYVARVDGESQFLHALRNENPAKMSKAKLVLPLILLAGGVAPCVAQIGAVGLGLSRRSVLALSCVFALGFFLLPFDPRYSEAAYRNPLTGRPWALRFDTPIFLVLGLIVWGVGLAAAARLLIPRLGLTRLRRRRTRMALFLVSWLAIEVVGYFILSPFEAVRRIIGSMTVLTIIAGALASWRLRHVGRAEVALRMRPALILGVLLGLLFYGVDWVEARATREAAERSARWIRDRYADATIWFTGIHGFEYYAIRAGLRPVFPNDSMLRQGDWLIVQRRDWRYWPRGYDLDDSWARLETTLEGHDPIPLSTTHYYDHRRAMVRQIGPRWQVDVYRVVTDHAPSPPRADRPAPPLQGVALKGPGAAAPRVGRSRA